MSILKHQETKDMAASKQFTKVGDGLLVRAPGKINLSLLVAGKRPDGYHELETIMAKINWYDEILIEKKGEGRRQKAEGGGRNDEPCIELICKGPYKVPAGEDNLVYKAAKLILGKVKRKKERVIKGTWGGREDNADEEYTGGDRTGVGKQ